MGRSSRTTFFRVILPLLRPSIAGGSLLVALYTLSDFGAVSLLRYETFTWAIFLQYDSALDRTLAATMSLVLVAIALGIVAAEALTRGRARYFRSDPGAIGTGGRVRLGRWDLACNGLLFCRHSYFPSAAHVHIGLLGCSGTGGRGRSYLPCGS